MIELANGRARARIAVERGLLADVALETPSGGLREVLSTAAARSRADEAEASVIQSSGWPGCGAPVCFPFAGRVWVDGVLGRYRLDGAIHPMPIHGFLYAASWQMSTRRQDRVTLEAVTTPEMSLLFPFSFVFSQEICLTKATEVRVTYTAKNLELAAQRQMPVAFGSHPYFALTAPGGARSVDAFTLHTTATSRYDVTSEGRAGKSHALLGDNGGDRGVTVLPLSDKMFHNHILSAHRDPYIDVFCGEDHYLRLAWDESTFHHIVLWRDSKTGLYCIEPWMALPDAIAHGHGVRWLAPGESLSASYTVSTNYPNTTRISHSQSH